ncbi:MAG TPA: rubredoxin [Trinickia sp.]|jgi:rubredoxin|uniref:rubredoxin n=1 Tax=Trinickia sp. TaxID=2571163 RepID=UPI002C662270|nr:rubredoxin [Trinickia sp.]HTI18039.1 rubredoxin [Trinickia sp.]
MYKKGIAVEIQFSPQRLNDGAGDPCWIDLTKEEATRLLQALQERLAMDDMGTSAPVVVSLDETVPALAETPADTPRPNNASEPSAEGFKQWVCVICGWVYDEEAGCPEEGIPPGTRFADIPADWRCPLCDVGKEDFAIVSF